MPKFTGIFEDTVTVDASIERVKEHFADTNAIVAAYGELESHEKIDDSTLRFRLKPLSALGATFAGKYDCKYEFTSDDVFEWKTVGSGANIDTHARLKFTKAGENRTRIHYKETMTCDIEINRFMAKALKPIVDRDIAKGCKNFLQKMCKSI